MHATIASSEIAKLMLILIQVTENYYSGATAFWLGCVHQNHNVIDLMPSVKVVCSF